MAHKGPEQRPGAFRGQVRPEPADAPALRPVNAAGRARLAFRAGHHFEQMPVEILEVEAASATASVDLAVLGRARSTAEFAPGCLYAAQDGVELLIADVKRVVVALERIAVV